MGKISACIQCCMSLGITIQTQAYYFLKTLGGDPVKNYLIYAFVTFNLVGLLMRLSSAMITVHVFHNVLSLYILISFL